MFQYNFTLTRVIDGDTVDGIIDLGFGIFIKERVRLEGIDAPETRTRDLDEKQKGLESKKYLEELLENSTDLILFSKEFNKGKYGRVIGDILVDDGMVCELMLESGHAVVYD